MRNQNHERERRRGVNPFEKERKTMEANTQDYTLVEMAHHAQRIAAMTHEVNDLLARADYALRGQPVPEIGAESPASGTSVMDQVRDALGESERTLTDMRERLLVLHRSVGVDNTAKPGVMPPPVWNR